MRLPLYGFLILFLCVASAALGQVTIENCKNGIDDDGDGLIDCADTFQCAGETDCGFEERNFNCTDGIDNDGDGDIDGDDSDCNSQTPQDEICGNGLDDDGDGLVDCFDNECFSNSSCFENCTNGIDDNGNGLIDCADRLRCAGETDCSSESLNFNCFDGYDNDGDGDIDADDSDCDGATPPPGYCNDREALMKLYYATDGANWTTPWDTTQAISTWHGVMLNADGCVVELNFRDNNLVGYIPEEIVQFESLEVLDLRSNALTGSIPDNIGQLIDLKILMLSQNELSGHIPTSIGQLDKLIYLYLHSNQLSGHIPELTQLNDVLSILLNHNQLTGIIPESLSQLDKLQGLWLQFNQLSGNIPESFGQFGQLSQLYVEANHLSGILPATLSQIRSLRFLNIQDNEFYGRIPLTVDQLSDIQHLYVRNNYFTFSNLLPIQDVYQGNFQYTPQEPIDSLRTATGPVGSPLTLSTTIDRTTDPPSKYQWFKHVENGSDIVLQPSPTTNGHTYTINALTASDTGRYYYQITNDSMPDLTLTSHYVTVKLGIGEGSREQDSLALIAFYESIQNKAEWVGAWDTTQPMDSWSGVTITNGRVSSVDLSNQGLVATLPTELGDLTQVQTLNLSGNQLSGPLPSGWTSWSASATIDISDNLFTFQDIEPLLTGSPAFPGTLIYYPQGLAGSPAVITVAEGDPFTLPYTSSTPGNVYQWQKRVNGEWVDVAGATTASVTVPNASAGDAGDYQLVITNPSAPDLTLVTHPITVVVGGGSTTEFTFCEQFEDPTTNPTLANFHFDIDWNTRYAECLASATDETQTLLNYATTRLVQREASSFYQSYRTACLGQATETLEYTYTPQEYHYTLYYYDQSGLLVQTVPPEGVKPLTTAQVSNVLSGSTTTPPPSHTFKTTYRYNSLNQLTGQHTPDAGQSAFYYDSFGQLRLSQNAQQALDNHYSYTKYDQQGRTTEVGELTTTEALASLEDKLDEPDFPVSGPYALSDITRTYYDSVDVRLPEDFTQTYVRNRVAWTEVLDAQDDTLTTHYAYDAHGNVKSLRQHVPGLGTGSKRTDYVYDLVSGNVRFVLYQADSVDELVQEYRYDADNRLTQVYTSTDRVVWHQEAVYHYYPHGPLARVVLGEYSGVQGLDYYYTLQGWLKGVNGTNDSNDPGQDGIGTSRVGKDAFAFVLGYHEDDYQGIGATPTSNQLWDRLDEQHNYRGLYNGNIAWMQTNLPGLKQQGIDPQQAMLYVYDQLNRLVQAQSLRNFSESTGFASRTATPEAFDAAYSYDANGNLLTLQRRNVQAALQDDFAYQYAAGKNRLASVSDAVPAQTITYDTKVYDQGPIQSDGKVYRQITVEGSAEVPAGQFAMLQANELIHLKQDFHAKAGSGFHAKWTDEPNTETTDDDNSTFQYDAIGNLISDSGEGTNITWTPYGKVRSVTHGDGTVVNYRYDATGNRVEKSVVSAGGDINATRYIRDASGNVLAIYQNDSLNEQPIYGSSRLGVYRGGSAPGKQMLGNRRYELSNHLSTPLAIITDNVNMNADSAWATIVSTQDAFPYGLEMKGRSWQSEAYGFGMNGKRLDTSWGQKLIVDYGFRVYRPDLARFLSTDPLSGAYPWNSSYAFAEGSPIANVDLDGLEKDYYLNQKQSEIAGNHMTAASDATGIVPKVIVNAQTYHGKKDQFASQALVKSLLESRGTISLPRTNINHPNAHTDVEKASHFGVDFGEAVTGIYSLKYLPKLVKNAPKLLNKLKGADQTSTLFRVQGGKLPNASKQRFTVDSQGGLDIQGNDMLFVTFDDETRALQFLQKRGENAELVKLEVKKEFADKIKKIAVDQRIGRTNPGVPQQVDKSVTNNSFGIPMEYFDELLQNVNKDNVQIIKQSE